MDIGLKDQVALVAGSSRGIGRAIAAALLAEGVRVVLTGRDQQSLDLAVSDLAAIYGSERLLAIRGDFSKIDVIKSAVETLIEHFGRLDHLVANLGSGTGASGWDASTEEWDRLFELNFFASVRLAQGVLPHLIARGSRGSILFIASITALEATNAPLPYSAAKAALVNYSKNLAGQVARHKVRVNTIAPGNVLFAGGSWAARLEREPAIVEVMLQNHVPLGRFGTPEEIASLAVYVCSGQAGFITGGCFVMDGGQTRSL